VSVIRRIPAAVRVSGYPRPRWPRQLRLVPDRWQLSAACGSATATYSATPAATTGLTYLLGSVYWVIAAREFSPQAVGYGSAAVSAMTLIGTIGTIGLGTVLIGELPQRQERGGLISAALLTSGLGSPLLGLIFPLVADAFGGRFPEISGTPIRLVLFAIGVALTGG
jgi:O-antigen/teichoic acid export membrane protein